MKIVRLVFVTFLLCSTVLAQKGIESFDPATPLDPDRCFDLMKTVWDGLKHISEEYQGNISVKSEFETTAEFNARVRKLKDEYIAKIDNFSSEHKLNDKVYSVWMKADLVKYDADNQIYNVTSPTQILLQPKKKEIAVECSPNKYVSITEKNVRGYRFANFHLRTDPAFSWFVNKQTAQAAKSKEHLMFFKVSFKFEIGVNASDDQIVMKIIPIKLALLDQSENFTYWSEEIR